MNSTALVPVFTGPLAGQTTQLCNARDLHATLEVGKDFSTWIKDRIEQYGFSAGEDFSPIRGKTSRRGGRPATDYHLTLDMAKELAMVENNERGRQVRRYFIQIEKRARAQFNLRATMMEHTRKPSVALTADVQSAINRKAWAMAHDAYELFREHLTGRVAYCCEYGIAPNRSIKPSHALDLISAVTLDTALAPRHFDVLTSVLRIAEAEANIARENAEKIRAELEQKGIAHV